MVAEVVSQLLFPLFCVTLTTGFSTLSLVNFLKFYFNVIRTGIGSVTTAYAFVFALGLLNK